MTSTRANRECARVSRRTTHFLDGRVAAPERAAIQQHLRDCAACMQQARDIARLARATHNLPPHRVGADLAHRVRQGLADRRSRGLAELRGTDRPNGIRAFFAAPGVRAAAAGITLAAVWGIGFLAGHGVEHLVRPGPAASSDDEPANGARPTVTGSGSGRMVAAASATPADRPDATTPSRTERRSGARGTPMAVVDPEFVTASREMLADLAWVESLPVHARLPMVASQYELFDLVARADRLLRSAPTPDRARPIAHLVRDFGATLATGSDTIDWRAWSSAARAVQLAVDGDGTVWPTGPRAATRSADADDPTARASASARAGSGPRRQRPLADSDLGFESTITHVLANCSTGLSPVERDDLAEFLRCKRELVRAVAGGAASGTATNDAALGWLSEWRRSMTRSGENGRGRGDAIRTTTSFRLAASLRVQRTLTAAGRTDDAAALTATIERMACDLGLDPAIDLPPDR